MSSTSNGLFGPPHSHGGGGSHSQQQHQQPPPYGGSSYPAYGATSSNGTGNGEGAGSGRSEVREIVEAVEKMSSTLSGQLNMLSTQLAGMVALTSRLIEIQQLAASQPRQPPTPVSAPAAPSAPPTPLTANAPPAQATPFTPTTSSASITAAAIQTVAAAGVFPQHHPHHHSPEPNLPSRAPGPSTSSSESISRGAPTYSPDDYRYWLMQPSPAQRSPDDRPTKYPTMHLAKMHYKQVSGRPSSTLGRLPLKEYLEAPPDEYLLIRKSARKVYQDFLEPLVRAAKQPSDRMQAAINRLEHVHPLLTRCDGHWKARALLSQVLDNAIDEDHSKSAERASATAAFDGTNRGDASGSSSSQITGHKRTAEPEQSPSTAAPRKRGRPPKNAPAPIATASVPTSGTQIVHPHSTGQQTSPSHAHSQPYPLTRHLSQTHFQQHPGVQSSSSPNVVHNHHLQQQRQHSSAASLAGQQSGGGHHHHPPLPGEQPRWLPGMNWLSRDGALGQALNAGRH